MREVVKPPMNLLAAKSKPRARLAAENIVVRYQLNVLRRVAPKRPKLSNLDRLLLVWLHRRFSDVSQAVVVVRPKAIMRWHRGGFRLNWRWKSRPVSGGPRIPGAIRRFVRDMSSANPLWGAPRMT